MVEHSHVLFHTCAPIHRRASTMAREALHESSHRAWYGCHFDVPSSSVVIVNPQHTSEFGALSAVLRAPLL
jgi:hypothetical protein